MREEEWKSGFNKSSEIKPAKNGNRASSTVLSVVLLVIISVALAASLGVLVLEVGDEKDKTPLVSVEKGELVADRTGANDQKIILRHGSGEKVEVKRIELVIEVPESGKKVRVKNLPQKHDLEPSNVVGADILDGSWNGLTGEIDSTEGNNVWEAGEEIGVRIKNSKVRLDPGEKVIVTVVHQESDSVIAKEKLTAVEG